MENGAVSDETRPLKYKLRPESQESDDQPKRFLINYKEELNPSQYEAAVAHQGPLLVLAGAGSGKTRTLVFRVARMPLGPPSSVGRKTIHPNEES